jgi:hypothetical protein
MRGQKQIPFGTYTDKILEYANQTFATMYHKVFKQYWHDNKFFAKMNQNYTTTDWQNGTFETYIPTRDQTHGLSYYRIAIKLVPEIDKQTLHEEAQKLQQPMHSPTGQLDSELQIIISPKLKKWGFLHAFRHVQKKGYLTNVYITRSHNQTLPPEVLWVRILRFISEFLNKRILAFLDALKLQPYQWDHKDMNMLYYICNNSAILSRFSHAIRTSIVSMSHTLDVILHRIWSLKDEIGSQTLAKQAIKPLLDLKPDKLKDVFIYIRQELKDNLQRKSNQLNPLEVQLLYGGRRG